MNLVEESYKEKDTNKTKLISRIILVVIIVLVLAIIGIVVTIYYIDNSALKVYLNGNINNQLKDMLLIQEDGKIYIPIRDMASILNIQNYNGEYSNKSEDSTKCYIETTEEVANFTLQSNKIYKLYLNTTSSTGANYEYTYMDDVVISRNGKLYMTQDGMEKGFNASFSYDKEKNRIYIYTLDYLIQSYQNSVLEYGYTEIDSNFNNYKAVLNGMLVVKKDQYGVINAQTGETIIEPKYEKIEYMPTTGEFLITSNGKKGIMTASGNLKVQILYDEITLMDSDAGLLLAQRDGKYGVIDTNGNIKIYIEYDNIGIDITPYSNNNVKNKYILLDNLIPVQQDGKWGFFDKNGKQVVDFKYDSLGYRATTNKNAMNLLVIPNYNVMIVNQDNKYGIINSEGRELVRLILDDAYMYVSGGQTYYKMTYNNQELDIIEYLNMIDVSTGGTDTDTNSDSSNTALYE